MTTAAVMCAHSLATAPCLSRPPAVDDVVSKGAGKRGNAKAMGKGKAGGPTDLFRIIKMVMERK